MVKPPHPPSTNMPPKGTETTVMTPTFIAVTATDTAVTDTIAVVTEPGVPCKVNIDAGFQMSDVLI